MDTAQARRRGRTHLLWVAATVLLLAAGQVAAATASTTQDAAAAASQPQAMAVSGRASTQSTGKFLNRLAEFEIVNENDARSTGDQEYGAPTFMASIVASLFAVSGQDRATENLSVDGPYGIWSLDAEQRFFWSPVDNGQPRVSFVGPASAPKSVTVRGRWGGASTSVASIGRIGTRGVVPRDMALRIAAPKTCSYTWTDTKSFCHVIYTGNLTATTALDIDTTLGGFLEASLWQDAFPWMAYSEVTCTLDLAGKGGAYEKDCTNPLRYRSMTDLSLQAKVAQLSSQPTQTGPTAAGQGRGPGQGRP